MGNAGRIQYAVFVAALVLSAPVAAQESSTTCRQIGAEWRCTTKAANTPLDYGKIMQQGQDLVPTQPPRRPAPTPIQEPKRNAPSPSEPIWRGNGYLEACRKPDATAAMVCTIYLNGLVEGQRTAWDAAGVESLYCVPVGVTTTQIGAILIRYLDDNPSDRHRLTGLLVAASLRSAYPCPTK